MGRFTQAFTPMQPFPVYQEARNKPEEPALRALSATPTRDLRAPAPATTPTQDCPPETKRGRPPAWVPAALCEEDQQVTVGLVKRFGPDDRAAENFRARYAVFCEINGLDPTARTSLLAAIGQAINQGMAESSLATYVEAFAGSVRDLWYVRSIIHAAHANMIPRNPRPTSWDDEALKNLVSESECVADKVLLWLLLATGARASDVEKLTFQQVRVGADHLLISWWLRKAQRKRRERHEEEYAFAWSMAPPQIVREYLSTGPPTHGLFPLLPAYSPRRIANHVSGLLKTIPGEHTSYVFRDRMEAVLGELQTPPDMMKRLLDHDSQTSAAAYKKSPLAAEVADRVRQEKKRKK